MIIIRDFHDPDVNPPFGFGGDEDWVITAPTNDPALMDKAQNIADFLTVCDNMAKVVGDTLVIVTCHA